MELVQRNVACCRREKNGNSQQTCSFVIKAEPPCDAVTNGPHAGENSVLHRHKNHGMTENGEERGKEKNDWLDVVAEQGNVFDRDIETSVNQLPDRLNIIGEVEAPILEIRPARVGGPGPDKEEDDGDGCDNYIAWCSLVTFDHSWLGSLQLTRIFTAPVNCCQAQLEQSTKLAEGVGFEPTVGCPTLDFESSALNRTQPPFPGRKANAEHSTPNVQHVTGKATVVLKSGTGFESTPVKG